MAGDSKKLQPIIVKRIRRGGHAHHGGAWKIAYADFVAHGGEQGAKDAGKMRLEGAEYVVADGDILHVRFNV